jgi:hypothetical protein
VRRVGLDLPHSPSASARHLIGRIGEHEAVDFAARGVRAKRVAMDPV